MLFLHAGFLELLPSETWRLRLKNLKDLIQHHHAHLRAFPSWAGEWGGGGGGGASRRRHGGRQCQGWTHHIPQHPRLKPRNSVWQLRL